MAGVSANGLLNVRPVLSRSRSNTSPSDLLKPSQDVVQETTQKPKAPTRPGHFRSQSYISPIETKPPIAAILTAPLVQTPSTEPSRFHRLHLPGKHHHTNSEEHKPAQSHRKHRYTQSEAHQYQRQGEKSKPRDLHAPVITTTGPAEFQNESLYPSSRGSAIPSLKRMTTTRSVRDSQSGDQSFFSNYPSYRRRANSDPKSPTLTTGISYQNRPMTSTEKLIERSGLMLKTSRSITQSDLDKLTTQIGQAKSELSDRLTSTSRTASNLMRRLDEAHDTLHRTAESMVDTISSFSNLSQQSAKLVSNFETESAHLDSHLRHRLNHFRTNICTKRAERIDELQKRGTDVSNKAEQLGRRLENCRTIVNNWETREINKRKAWKGVWNGLFWGILLILIGVLAGIASWKAIDIHRHDKAPHYMMNKTSGANQSAQIAALKEANIPDDIRKLLNDIAVKQHDELNRKIEWITTTITDDRGQEQKAKEKANKKMRLLDEL